MSIPRHLKFSSDAKGLWTVYVGDIQTGRVERVPGVGYCWIPNKSDWPLPVNFMEKSYHGMRAELAKRLDKDNYMKILDFAYKNGYKG